MENRLPDFCVATDRAVPHRPLSQAARHAGGWLARLIAAGFDWYGCHREKARQRRTLGGYDDHMLKDIGLSRADVEDELAKGFWH